MKAVAVRFNKHDGRPSPGSIADRHASRMEAYLQARAIETAAVEKAFEDVLRQYQRELAKVEARYKARARRSFKERDAAMARV